MSVLLITYDLNKEVNRPNITGHLKKGYPDWAKLSESSYAVNTLNTPEQVKAYMKPVLDSNDHIYILTLKRPYTGFGPPNVNNWLERNLTF